MLSNLQAEVHLLRQKLTKLNGNEKMKDDSKNEICIDSKAVFRNHEETWSVKSIDGECAECICKVKTPFNFWLNKARLLKIILFSEISSILQDHEL